MVSQVFMDQVTLYSSHSEGILLSRFEPKCHVFICPSSGQTDEHQSPFGEDPCSLTSKQSKITQVNANGMAIKSDSK